MRTTWRNLDTLTVRAMTRAVWWEGAVLGFLTGAVVAALLTLALEWWMLG